MEHLLRKGLWEIKMAFNCRGDSSPWWNELRSANWVFHKCGVWSCHSHYGSPNWKMESQISDLHINDNFWMLHRLIIFRNWIMAPTSLKNGDRSYVCYLSSCVFEYHQADIPEELANEGILHLSIFRNTIWANCVHIFDHCQDSRMETHKCNRWRICHLCWYFGAIHCGGTEEGEGVQWGRVEIGCVSYDVQELQERV